MLCRQAARVLPALNAGMTTAMGAWPGALFMRAVYRTRLGTM
jgi:hypothetical protein